MGHHGEVTPNELVMDGGDILDDTDGDLVFDSSQATFNTNWLNRRIDEGQGLYIEPGNEPAYTTDVFTFDQRYDSVATFSMMFAVCTNGNDITMDIFSLINSDIENSFVLFNYSQEGSYGLDEYLTVMYTKSTSNASPSWSGGTTSFDYMPNTQASLGFTSGGVIFVFLYTFIIEPDDRGQDVSLDFGMRRNPYDVWTEWRAMGYI